MLYTLILEYTNHYGDGVFRHLPMFTTLAECEWWRSYFLEMLDRDHATIIRSACELP